jgi:hypothetical protein
MSNKIKPKPINSSIAWFAFTTGAFCAALVPAYAEISTLLYAASFSAAIVGVINDYKSRKLVAITVSQRD